MKVTRVEVQVKDKLRNLCSLSTTVKNDITFHQYNVLLDLILYVPVKNFSVMSGRVFLGLTSTKQRMKCLAQGHNAVPLVRLEPTTH